ncbi:TonB-dependent receptor [Parvicella tangerina]|uniref:Vitamin B12 transporter BtuB n=1 Tax=Parvicella tangerina TaxID=2829795 RepID=A0A916JLZ5_9FLAO|nr:TonB-dependent receptor [Parvicella tangerina]CAG5081111.1 Vitamin B12 transporter BtuB [Parvicella tangerina]
MLKVLYILITVILPLSSLGQTIYGTVTDKNGKPLEFVNIYEKVDGIGTTTDELGKYKIENLPTGEHKLIVSFVGYIPFEESFYLSNGNSLKVDVVLEEDTQSLDEFVVSGTMKPISKTESAVPVEVYNTEFFKANPTPSLFESMENVNGVRPQNNCNVCNTGDIHINGLEGSYTMVLIDGMPLVSGLSTVYGLTGIPQSLIERVEVVKGPASTLYGSEAIGGLINVITKTPVNAPIFSADVFSSSWGEVNTDLGFRFGKKEKFNSIIGVNYFNYQNPIDHNNDGFTDLTLQDRISVFNKWSFNRKQSRVLNIAFRYNYEDRWGGQMNWTPVFRGGDSVYGESIYTSRWETFGTYQLPTKEKVFFQFSGNGHQQNSTYGDTWYIADQYVGFGQLYWNKVTKKHDITSALVYRYTYYDDNTPATSFVNTDSSTSINQPNITHLPGVFVQDNISIGTQSKLLLGMRYDYNSIHGNIFTPRVNYKWSSKDLRNTLRIGGGTGYRVVNVFTEDHAALTGARTVIFEEALKPETSYNANLNYVHKAYLDAGLLNIDFSGWFTYFTNKIVPDYETNANTIYYGNLNGSAKSQGVSLNVDLYLKNGFRFLIGSTLMDVLIKENNIIERQLLTENFTGNFTLGYELKQIGLSIDYTGKVYSPMRLPLLGELDNRSEHSPWFSIQNIQLTKSLGKQDQFEVYGGIKNLLNYTPPSNSIARAFDPFDRGVIFDNDGNAIPTENNPNALTFDPAYVYASNQGIRGFIGMRYSFK